MSLVRVVTGTDEHGRPKTEWQPVDRGAEPRYGFMEPAFSAPVERRQVTPEELEAIRSRDTAPAYLAPTVRPPQEVPLVSEVTPDPDRQGLLDRLAAAAVDARTAHEEMVASSVAWDIAREALARAYAEVEGIVEPLPAPPDDDHVHHILTVPLVPPDAVVAEVITGRSRVGEGQRSGQASARDRRARMVMAAMAEHDNDQGAVAAALGMKKNAVAQIVKYARLRESQS